jgi:hypothetical protein
MIHFDAEFRDQLLRRVVRLGKIDQLADEFLETGLHLLRLIDCPHLLLLQLLGRAPGGDADPNFPCEYQEHAEPDQKHGPKAMIGRRMLMHGRLDVRLLVHS